MHRRLRGFTVIELVVAISIVLILVAVAFASYQDYLSRKSRAEVSAALVELSAWLKQQRVTIGNYQMAKLPYTQVPYVGTPRYQLSLLQADMRAADPKAAFPAASESAFTLQADPIDDDGCGALLIDQTGRRGVTGAGARVEDCWGK